jgi:hypothetical protein
MAPDVPLFFRLGVSYWATHTFPGMFLVGIPVAFVLFAVWRVLLRPVAAELSPRWLGARWPVEWRGGVRAGWWSLWGAGESKPATRWRAAGLLVASFALGAATHVVWDLFTHEGRWGGELFPALDERWGAQYGATWLHLGSSVFGLAVIAWWGYRWLARQRPNPDPPETPSWLRVGLWIAIPACLVAAAGVQLLLTGMPDPASLKLFIHRSGTSGAAAILLALAAASGIAHVIVARKPRHSVS